VPGHEQQPTHADQVVLGHGAGRDLFGGQRREQIVTGVGSLFGDQAIEVVE
jgi:hypothetical protein